MNRLTTYLLLIILFTHFFIYSCSGVRESAGVNRKSPDEFQVIENPPLVIPPDYGLVSPDQLQGKKIDNVEKELAEEILFGLEENELIEENQLSTMNIIISKTNADEISDTIREEIDANFEDEINIKDQNNLTWEDEIEVLDAVKESEKIRENNFNEDSILEDDIPIKKQKVKKKKKKRFFFF